MSGQARKGKTEPPKQAVRDLAKGIDPVVYAGVSKANGWGGSETMTAAAFESAVETWLQRGSDV